MPEDKLLLVDYESVHHLDMSGLDESFRAIVFVGANQNPPRLARKAATAHRFTRVDFQKVHGAGPNALDFYIACQLGRVLETARDTTCIVLSKDKGFDPLLQHLNSLGLKCSRHVGMAELIETFRPEVVCLRCKKSRTIELHGGYWCANCGRYARPPDPALLPSNQPGYRELEWDRFSSNEYKSATLCGWCEQSVVMSEGIYDDGEWMCGACIARYAAR